MVVKNACSCREPKLCSQHTQDSSQPSITPVPDPVPLLASLGIRQSLSTHTYTGTNTYNQKSKIPTNLPQAVSLCLDMIVGSESGCRNQPPLTSVNGAMWGCPFSSLWLLKAGRALLSLSVFLFQL